MSVRKRRFLNFFFDPVSSETVRAFSLFAVLFVVLGGIAGQLAFGELSLKVLERRANLGRSEATRIADAVAALGRDEGVIDFHLLRQKKKALEKVVLERIASRPYIRHVEVRDRFGMRLLYVSRNALTSSIPGVYQEDRDDARVVTVQLMQGAHPEGEVRVGISSDRIQQELADLRRSLRIKAAIATAIGIGVLAVALLYVVHLVRKNRQLEQSRIAAERRSYVGLLASGLAHEIRNPLNAMNMNLQMLEEELQVSPAGQQDDYLDLLASTKSEIKRLEQLANNFLSYARPREPRFETKDLNEVLREVGRFLAADFRQSGVRLGLDLEPLLPRVELDETLFKQALMNILVNARQVLKSGGSVGISSRAGSGGEAVIEIRDDGPGIPTETREKVFEIFFSKRGGGTGLGLPIARQIVERHGGTIEVECGEDGGTTFRIRLPRRQPGEFASPAPTEAAP